MHLQDGRWHTLVTSTFVPPDDLSVLPNLLVLWDFGPGLRSLPAFLGVYFGSGAVGALVELYGTRDGDSKVDFGPTNAVFGVLAAWTALQGRG